MNYFIEALYILYPTVVTTVGNIAYDIDGNVVSYDSAYVQDYADKLSCSAQAKQFFLIPIGHPFLM